MPRKQKYNPQKDTLNTRFNNNPYFYKKRDTQNGNNPKYSAFIRDLRTEFRNLRIENYHLKNQLSLKVKTVKELEAENEMLGKTIELLELENVLHKKELDLIKKENAHRNNDKDKYVENLIKENEKLNEQIKIYNKAIEIYQNEIAMKISGQVKPEFDSYFLNFD
jgi:predicted RNase H-like nuclease (RuvC/YqgF family)